MQQQKVLMAGKKVLCAGEWVHTDDMCFVLKLGHPCKSHKKNHHARQNKCSALFIH